MDKKAQKKLDVLRQKIQKLQQLLVAAKKQNDEPGEVERLEKEIHAHEAEIKKLKA
jgi:peptidoglycan hydrolase CwlO-like protein